ncbi:GAF domain-containing SpoIIE family protein phosphatase, partial [Spirochaetota bacterium]
KEAYIFLYVNIAFFIILSILFFILRDKYDSRFFSLLYYRLHIIAMFVWGIIVIGQMSLYTDYEFPFLVTNRDLFIYLIICNIAANVLYFHKDITSVIKIGRHFEIIALYFQTISYVFLLFFTNKVISIFTIDLQDKIESRQHEKNVTVKLLHDIGSAIVEANNQNEVLDLINNSAVETTDARAGAIWIYNENISEFELVSINGVFPPLKEVKSYILERTDRIVNKTKSEKFNFGDTYAGNVAKTQKPLFVKDLIKFPKRSVKQTVKGIIDINSLIAVPIMLNEQVLGVMAVINKESFTNNFNENDLSMMLTLAEQGAITINHFRLFRESIEKKMGERDVQIASQIQKGLQPSKFLNTDKFEIHGFSYAAKGVGGDYFDYIDFSKDRYGIIMSDVAGKGVPASLVMVMIRSIFRTYATTDRGPCDVIGRVNESIADDVSQERYATFFYYVLDIKKMTVWYSNAAHGPLLLYRKHRNEFEFLDTDGMPIGITKEGQYEEKTVKVEAGDILVLYTDGITEAMNMRRDQYTIERLQEMVEKNGDKPVQEMTKIIYEDIVRFVAGAEQHDDQTLLIAKIK